MAGSWKKLKAGQFKRTATVEIMDGKELLFHSLNPVKEKAIISNLLKVVDVPIKERKATKEEKDEYEKINPSTNKVAIRELKVVYYDYTDETYQKELKDEDAYALAWTTTPWTLPANTGIMVHPDFDYSEIELSSGEHWIIAKELVSKIMSMLETGYTEISKFRGKEFPYQKI